MASTEHHVAEEAIELKSPSPGERYPQSIDEKNRKGSISTEVDTEVSVYFEEGDEVELRESDYTPEQYKKLLRKVDKFLLPLMWCCYGIQQTDKTSLGTQALFGLREDTGLVGQQYQWLTTIFYLSYLCGEFPSNFLLQRWALGRCLSIYMLCWGIVVISIAAAQN
ncbi:hypothetical protein LZ554_007696 [Drepanopeziza brunnea f. sp. 'monogermtubi']|nr:hypothetical protein LZ554_007696 [Drepanopeziza brunnea f. sp. 'monogermtubi']